ncbi:Adaptor protein complex AP-3 delta subunit [Neurospora tetrasperma FGSC 2509]|nr:Adaptor protein complex AP-3 delta subunit [Neurospora tetrasperma FGSC 2509]
MDVKATALLKIIYLEMNGHDMSWASFHVLEVMSSPKYHQKRVGYLGAVQSFKTDTEVLMLATNLLKKDLSASSPIVISLPIAALPHIITPSLALSVLADLLPRLSHSHSAIRKKTIVTLYRLALVYPETLRAAWPKIKERLMDKHEDPSVTAAIVNVVCELGWRRPQDFLPLAPRLFELLVDGGNNWMAIKLIKLFATLTPLEPRLVRKLLPPLTDLIRTTPAMSLLYECINGIIQGGILGDSEDDGREEIASLCVSKLRGMITFNGDANCEIVVTHPFLVAQQEDVIMECIDSEDITIRIKALDLVQGMVSSDNLVSIVSRLMRQLKTSTNPNNDQLDDLSTDSSEEMGAERRSRKRDEAPPLPEDYTIDVIGRILKMCSQNNYSSVVDFDWYIDVLTQLIRIAPASRKEVDSGGMALGPKSTTADISESIGNELRNVAVKVKALIPRIRPSEVLATCLQASMKLFALIAGNDQTYWTAERKSMVSLLMARVIHTYEPLVLHPSLEVQERAIEFTELLKLTAEAASAQASSTDELEQDPPLLLTQAIPSLFQGWELNSVAVGAQLNVPMPEGLDLDEPIHSNLSSLLAQADSLMLPIQEDDEFSAYYNEKAAPTSISSEPAINRLRDAPETTSGSYQQATEDSYLDADIIARRKAERAERNRDDPFYIGDLGSPSRSQGTSTPIHNILQNENGPDLDIDSIPIMKLDLGAISSSGVGGAPGTPQRSKAPKSRPQIVVAADETLVGSRPSTPRTGSQHDSDADPSSASAKSRAARKLKQSLLQVDSSHLRNLSLEASHSEDSGGALPHEKLAETDAEMAKAMKEVQRLRLEMQRANERIHVAQGVPTEGVVVKSKKKKEGKKAKSKSKSEEDGAGAGKDEKEKKVVKKKKKKAETDAAEGGEGEGGPVGGEGEGEAVIAVKKKEKEKVKKKKPKRIIQLGDEDDAGAGARAEAGEP